MSSIVSLLVGTVSDHRGLFIRGSPPGSLLRTPLDDDDDAAAVPIAIVELSLRCTVQDRRGTQICTARIPCSTVYCTVTQMF